MENTQLTYGERLVGLTFNPAGDDKVAKAKRLCADLADLLKQHSDENRPIDPLIIRLTDHAFSEILNAQMNVVKVLTFK